MSDSVREILDRFDALPEVDKRTAVVELLRRSKPFSPDISATQFDQLADELFSTLDAEEAAHGRR
jgi:hypothetical protein